MAYGASMQEDTMRKGPWLEEEDEQLANFVGLMGERRWDSIARASGLKRSGKSCRLRWLNYLRPDLKHGQISPEEECLILQLQERWGNKWSRIARRLPGRTDNEIKNYWRTYLRKKAQAQEQEKLQSDINNAEKCLMQESDLSIDTNSSESSGSGKEDILSTTEQSVDVLRSLSDYTFAFSPYEAHLSDWVSESFQNQDGLKHHGECDMLDTSVWDYCTDFLWDYGLN